MCSDQYWGLHFVCMKFTFPVPVCNSSIAGLLPSHLLQKRQAYWNLLITANLCIFNNCAIREPPPPLLSSDVLQQPDKWLTYKIHGHTRNKQFLIYTTCLNIVWLMSILNMLVSEGKQQKSIMGHPDEECAWRSRFSRVNKSKWMIIRTMDKPLAFYDLKNWNRSIYVSGFLTMATLV